jgi:uncharacterized protein YacL
MVIKRALQIAGILLGAMVARQWSSGGWGGQAVWMGGVTGHTASTGNSLFLALGALIGLLLATVVAGPVADRLTRGINQLVLLPAPDLVAGTAGGMLGLAAGALAYPFVSGIPRYGELLATMLTVTLVYAGAKIAWHKKEELAGLFARRTDAQANEAEEPRFEEHKILDTSVIIDGRIADICKTGFIEGTLVIPEFVLEELQHIADSSDLLKRNRGRRGLDILNKIQKELDVKVLIYEDPNDDGGEVDGRLVKLAKALRGKVVTNDFNLNKVCELQGVPVLNINDLANAVKPVVLPGEEIVVHVIKDGKEHGQGVAYLDDGTMIVVENGRDFIGSTMEVLVTSVLQTSAGRMIFAKPKMLEKAL